MNAGAWEEGDKRKSCGGSVRNAYAGRSAGQEGDRSGGPWLPSAGRTEHIAADPLMSTPETEGEYPHIKSWVYRGRELREKSFRIQDSESFRRLQNIAGKTVETKTNIYNYYL